MHEPFTHAHHMEKITFPQLPNGRDKLLTWAKHTATTSVSRPQTRGAKPHRRETQGLPVVLGPTLYSHSPDPHPTLVDLLCAIFAPLSVLHKTHILRPLFLPS